MTSSLEIRRDSCPSWTCFAAHRTAAKLNQIPERCPRGHQAHCPSHTHQLWRSPASLLQPGSTRKVQNHPEQSIRHFPPSPGVVGEYDHLHSRRGSECVLGFSWPASREWEMAEVVGLLSLSRFLPPQPLKSYLPPLPQLPPAALSVTPFKGAVRLWEQVRAVFGQCSAAG